MFSAYPIGQLPEAFAKHLRRQGLELAPYHRWRPEPRWERLLSTSPCGPRESSLVLHLLSRLWGIE